MCSFFLINILFFSSLILAQQPYIRQTACDSSDSSTSAFGYSCNGVKKNCQAYLIFRSQPPHNSVSSISTLLSCDPTQLSRINTVSDTESFQTNKMVIAPVSCSCSGEFYQANASYVVKGGETYFTIATSKFQGLSTCQALKNQSTKQSKDIYSGSKINVPLRCACPTKNQSDEGVNYLLTYPVAKGEYVYSISTRFGVATSRTLEGNGLSEEDSTIYPNTTLLVPLQNPPSSSQTTPSPPPPPSPPPLRASLTRRSKKTRVYVVVGVVTGSALLVVIGTVIFCSFLRPKKKNTSLVESDSVEALNKSGKSEKNSGDFLESISSMAQSLKVYSFEELESATDNFSRDCLIKGSVYRGNINDGFAAIKKKNGDVSMEINLLNKINHFNVIRLSGVCFDHGSWYLVYEFAINGPLSDWIYNSNRSEEKKILNWTEKLQISLDIATGINYLHSYTSPPHVHMDIKSSNVLLDSDFRAKLNNFSQARAVEGQEGEFALTRHIVGTKGYMAPEYLENGLVSPKLDVYSFGVLMMEILSGKQVSLFFKEENAEISDVLGGVIKEGIEKQNLKGLVDPFFEDNFSVELAIFMLSMVVNCLKKDPSGRPYMDEIVQSLSRLLNASLAWELSNNVSRYHSCS